MSTDAPVIANRSRRFWAYVIDQVLLGIISVVVVIAVFSTQVQPLTNAINAFFDDPLWTQAEHLSSEELNKRTEVLMSSEKVTNSVKALAYPFALTVGLTSVASATYYIVPTKKWGVTLGKRLVHIKVSTLGGELPDWWQSSVRYFAFMGLGSFGSVVSVLDLVVNKSFAPSNIAVNALTVILSQAAWILSLITIIFIIARADRRGLHDLLAHTIVYATPKTK